MTAPRRIVQTFEYEGDPEHPNLDILTFPTCPTAAAASTACSVYPSVEARDAMLDVDSGMDEDFERLDEHLASGCGATA